MAEDTTPNPFIEADQARRRRGSQCWVCQHDQRDLMEEAYRQGVRYASMLDTLQKMGDPEVTYAKISRHFITGHHERPT